MAIFAAGSLWSAGGQAVLGAVAPDVSRGVERWVGFTYTLAGVAALFVLARWIECRKNRPAPPLNPAVQLAADSRPRQDGGGRACSLYVAAGRRRGQRLPWRSRRIGHVWGEFLNSRGGAGRPLDILAIGSSSTEGIGASAPAFAYPAQLEKELTHEDGIAANVKNAGVGEELAAKTCLVSSTLCSPARRG